MLTRLRLRDRADFSFATPVKTKSSTGEVQLTAGLIQAASAVVQPNNGSTALELYGQRTQDTRRLYAPSDELHEGDWVYLNVDPGTHANNPDFRVLRIIRTPHGSICEIGKRGVFGG